MKRQFGFRVMMGAAWLVGAGAIGGVSAADSPMKDQAIAGPAQLKWAALSRDAQTSGPAQLDWAALSSQTELARNDAPTYIGTSLTETQAPGRLDWAALSK
ncbi:MAG: hypothetical protein WCA45_01380 [Thiobacillaceae bacterium]